VANASEPPGGLEVQGAIQKSTHGGLSATNTCTNLVIDVEIASKLPHYKKMSIL